MTLIYKKKLLLIVLMGLSFCLANSKITRAATWATPKSWSQTTAAPGKEAGEKSGAEAQEAQKFKNTVEQLKNRRDAEIASLVKERNAKIQTIQDNFKQLSQKEVAQIKQDKQLIDQKKIKAQDMKKAQATLMQQEQALVQQSASVQKQIANIQAAYQQQIQNLAQAYAEQFAALQQQMSNEK